MATLTQAHAFTPIPSNLDDNSILNNANRVSVSKIKAHQTSFVNHVSKQNVCNNNNNSKPITRINGTTSPKPHTTSQNHPPKIKLLNRSIAVTQAPPTKESNGTDDDLNVSDTETVEQTSPIPESKPETSKGKLNRTQSQENQTDTAVSKTCSSEKEKKEKSTPLKYNNTSTPPKQSSFEYSSSPSSTTSSLNRENSLDYKDSTGVDLHEFMVKTLKENPRDRLMLLKLERDFTDFINDVHKMCYKYPPMTSYHRMLIHRVAAYFGLDHNVDSSGKSVVISKTPASRIPEVRFQSYCSREYTDEEISAVPKSILLRSTSSSEEAVTPPRYESPLALDRRYGLEDKQAKSIEEREEDYIKAKERIFKRESLEMDVAGPLPNEILEKSPRHVDHISPSADSTQSEKEAAIAAVAAATGNKQNSSQGATSKRLNDRRNVGLLRFSSPATQQYSYNWPSNGDSVTTPTEQYNYGNNSYTPGTPSPIPQVDGYPPGGTAIQINPQTGQPVIGPDGNPIYYQTGYQQPAGNVAYVANGSNAAYVSQQGQYVPYYYVSAAGQQSASGNPPQGSQYYIMQPAQSGHYVYMPAQGVANQSPSGSLVVSQQPHPGDYNNQMANLTLSEQRRGSLAREDISNKSQPSTPTSPADASPIVPRPTDFPAQPRQVVYFSNGRAVQAPVYDQGNYPLQMYQGVACSYTTYPVNQDSSGNQTSTPTVPAQRSPAPNIIAQQYGSVQNARPPAPQPSQQHIRGQVNHSSPRPRFVSGIISNPRASGSAVYLPVANGNQATMLIAGQYPNIQMNCANVYPVHDAYRHSDKNSGSISDSTAAEYQKVTQNMNQQTRNLIQVNQQRPIIQIQPTYQTYQAYITHPQRFVANPAYNKQPVWSNGSSHRKYRNTRNQSSNQQIRISRPNSSSNDADQKTVSHILEIYDFPTTVTSDADAIFDEIKSSGARILKINSSSSQSLNNSHGSATNQKPTILAIFKSAGEAQRALESVTSPYYKLRVSQKSPTHFAGSDCPTSTLVKNSN